jgi:hypothetical protein
MLAAGLYPVILSSVPDPDPPDPYFVGFSGSGCGNSELRIRLQRNGMFSTPLKYIFPVFCLQKYTEV